MRRLAVLLLLAAAAALVFTAAWNANQTALTVTDRSVDPDGQIVAWLWNFGDGTTSTQRNPPAHSWSRPGNYTVKLIVTDNTGQQGAYSVPVAIAPGSNRGTLAH